MAGGVTVVASVDELPKVSLAVLAESLRAVMLCLHAGQDRVLVNGDEASQWELCAAGEIRGRMEGRVRHSFINQRLR